MYTVRNKLTKDQQNNLFIKLAKALSLLRNSEEVAQFIKDLLSEPEVLMLARRLQIAEMLTEGWTYEQIRNEIKVGQSTIARVHTWLELNGEGYRTVIKRFGKKETKDESSKPFARVKRKYPLYFWPELLLEELVKNANKREKQRLLNVLEQLRDKTKLSKQLLKLLQ